MLFVQMFGKTSKCLSQIRKIARLNMSTENCSRSTVNVGKVSYLWEIRNYNFCEAQKSLISTSEFSGNKNDVKWRITLQPCSNRFDVSLYLSEKSESNLVYAYHSISLLDEKLLRKPVENDITVRKFRADLGDYWTTSFYKSDSFADNLISNDFVLKISCKIIFSRNKISFENYPYCNSFSAVESTFANNNFTENLTPILENLPSNMVISVKDKTYPAHKGVLAAKSKVFAAMFQHEMKETELNRIQIEDIDEEIVGEMLRYIYFGKCEKLDKLAGGLLAAADKYCLNQLKIICVATLCKNLSVDNAAQNLILADMHNSPEMKTEVMKLIVAKPTEVFDTAGWKTILSYPRLIDEVCRAIARQ